MSPAFLGPRSSILSYGLALRCLAWLVSYLQEWTLGFLNIALDTSSIINKKGNKTEFGSPGKCQAVFCSLSNLLCSQVNLRILIFHVKGA